MTRYVHPEDEAENARLQREAEDDLLVIQADRDAAADYLDGFDGITEDYLAELRGGTADGDPAVQAFARHRMAERDRCAVAAEKARLPVHYQWGEDAMEQFDFGKERAAAAIRGAA